jgi:predicted esterase
MTRADREREIEDYVEYLDLLVERILESLARPGAHLTVLGFSQGVATATRWAVLGQRLPDRLILWGDTLPPDLPPRAAAERLSAVDVVSIVGDGDRTRREDAERAEGDALAEWGIERTVIRWPGGHVVDPDVLSELAEG